MWFAVMSQILVVGVLVVQVGGVIPVIKNVKLQQPQQSLQQPQQSPHATNYAETNTQKQPVIAYLEQGTSTQDAQAQTLAITANYSRQTQFQIAPDNIANATILCHAGQMRVNALWDARIAAALSQAAMTIARMR